MEKISALNCPRFTALQIELLQAKGIKSLMDFIATSREDVCSVMEITEDDYNIIRQQMLLYLRPYPVSLKQAVSRSVVPISTGISGLDLILGGGLFPGNVIELYGKTGTGKTQLCLYLSAQICHFSSEDSCVLYFDMKNDFNANRLLELCDNSIKSLENVRVFKEANFESLLSRLDDIKSEFVGGISGIYCKSKLLIIDSVPMVIYPVVQKENYSWRAYQEKLMGRLHWISNHLRLSVILVNHAVTTRSTNKGSSYFIPDIKAAMGKFWQAITPTRILLIRDKTVPNRFKGILDKCSNASVGQKFEFIILSDKLVSVNTDTIMAESKVTGCVATPK